MLEALRVVVGCMAQLGLQLEIVERGAASLFFLMKPLRTGTAGAWIALDTISEIR
jgi:hypothetical protein